MIANNWTLCVCKLLSETISKYLKWYFFEVSVVDFLCEFRKQNVNKWLELC